MHSDDSVAVKVPVKPSQSPSTSQKPRQQQQQQHTRQLLDLIQHMQQCILMTVLQLKYL